MAAMEMRHSPRTHCALLAKHQLMLRGGRHPTSAMSVERNLLHSHAAWRAAAAVPATPPRIMIRVSSGMSGSIKRSRSWGHHRWTHPSNSVSWRP